MTLRADHVGSLLRPPALLRRRARTAALDPAAFKRIEDARCARSSRCRSRRAWRSSPTAELRRESFQSELTAAVDGVEGAGIDAWLWGDWHSETVGDQLARAAARLAVTERLRRRRFLAAEEFTFLRACDHAHRQGHAAEPDAVRQPLGPGALARPPTRASTTSWPTSSRSSSTRSASSPAGLRATCSSTRRTTRC